VSFETAGRFPEEKPKVSSRRTARLLRDAELSVFPLRQCHCRKPILPAIILPEHCRKPVFRQQLPQSIAGTLPLLPQNTLFRQSPAIQRQYHCRKTVLPATLPQNRATKGYALGTLARCARFK